MNFRTGLGYDIHRFKTGRPLVLGGVLIPYERGLDGHSDADVVLHALCDALLGAVGMGDIGEHFPNTDQTYKDADSMDLLNEVYKKVRARGFKLVNADIVIQAQEPNLKKYKPEMIQRISDAVCLNPEDVNIKATTQEELGSLGRKEGIAAFANVLIYKE